MECDSDVVVFVGVVDVDFVVVPGLGVCCWVLVDVVV